MKCGYCNGPISDEEDQMLVVETVRVLGPRTWRYHVEAYSCPHCGAVVSVERPPKT